MLMSLARVWPEKPAAASSTVAEAAARRLDGLRTVMIFLWDELRLAGGRTHEGAANGGHWLEGIRWSVSSR
ncbi:MAG: hypothetical protein H6926_04140 [Chromatiales bacterium]|nr:hypothetical protein [Gammaproteobacteria bacterium]MCP5352365.1 hypothetical protein [Chromatiales bacterium]